MRKPRLHRRERINSPMKIHSRRAWRRRVLTSFVHQLSYRSAGVVSNIGVTGGWLGILPQTSEYVIPLFYARTPPGAIKTRCSATSNILAPPLATPFSASSPPNRRCRPPTLLAILPLSFLDRSSSNRLLYKLTSCRCSRFDTFNFLVLQRPGVSPLSNRRYWIFIRLLRVTVFRHVVAASFQPRFRVEIRWRIDDQSMAQSGWTFPRDFTTILLLMGDSGANRRAVRGWFSSFEDGFADFSTSFFEIEVSRERVWSKLGLVSNDRNISQSSTWTVCSLYANYTTPYGRSWWPWSMRPFLKVSLLAFKFRYCLLIEWPTASAMQNWSNRCNWVTS